MQTFEANAERMARFLRRGLDAADGQLVLRFEFRHATIWGDWAAIRYGKKHATKLGELSAVTPIRPEDREFALHSSTILIRYRETAPCQRRYEQRQRLKRVLGPLRKLVGMAMKHPLYRFRDKAAELVDQVAKHGWTLQQLWQLARGRKFLAPEPEQLELFPS